MERFFITYPNGNFAVLHKVNAQRRTHKGAKISAASRQRINRLCNFQAVKLSFQDRGKHWIYAPSAARINGTDQISDAEDYLRCQDQKPKPQ